MQCCVISHLETLVASKEEMFDAKPVSFHFLLQTDKEIDELYPGCPDYEASDFLIIPCPLTKDVFEF